MAQQTTLKTADAIVNALHQCNEHFAAGYMRHPNQAPVLRFAHALASHLRHMQMPKYQGETLYPCTPGWYFQGSAVEFHYSSCITYNRGLLLDKLEKTSDTEIKSALEAVDEALREYPGVGGYTHSIPNYRRILAEGLNSYQQRIEEKLEIVSLRQEQKRVEFLQALQILIEAIKDLLERTVETIKLWQPEDEAGSARQARLIAALENCPWQPANSFYEAITAINFLLYLDGPDDLGRFDQDLWPYYNADKQAGIATAEEAIELIRQIWRNIDLNSSWNVALGGLLGNGQSAVNELTHLCLKAGEGMRRPNLALRLHKDAPQTIWESALNCIQTGAGLPALYNEEGYLDAIRAAHLGVSEADLPDFAFGGCTELMVHGKSNVGSLEGDINLPLVLVSSLWNRLPQCETFDEFFAAYKQDLSATIRELVNIWNANQEIKAKWQPQLLRSLMIDDCIENAREYNDGGARYNWCVVNVMGLANAIDSLAAVRELVYNQQGASREELVAALQADFAGYETLQKQLESCPRFGNGMEEVDALATEVSRFVFEELRLYAPWRGGRYIPSCLMFVTYAMFGKPVGATPDGRKAGMPIADSAGAFQGRDRNGPTSMVHSITHIRHDLAPGTLVVNSRFSKKYFTDPELRAKLIALVKSYFELGGLQLQMNVVDQAILEDAMEHPEKHGDLIIRMGGYSEFWTHLDDELRRSVLSRVEHE